MDPSKRTVYEESIQEIRDSMRDRTPQELTRDQVVESVKRLEGAKFEAQKKMYELVRSQRVAPQMVNAVIQVEKLKADDHFFNETGIEEEDVEPNLKRMNLEEEDDFKAVFDEFKKKSDEFLASKKDETAAMMQKAQIAHAQQEARRRAALAAAAKKKAEAGAAGGEDAKKADEEEKKE